MKRLQMLRAYAVEGFSVRDLAAEVQNYCIKHDVKDVNIKLNF